MKYIMTVLCLLSLFDTLYAQELNTTKTLEDYLQENPTTIEESQSIHPQLQILHNRIATGDVEALFETGIFYFRGVEVERNISKAIHYLTLAAQEKHPRALYNLGTLYLDGTLVEQDITKGLTYLEEAVQKKYIPAQVGYAFLYLDGAIVGKNIEKAYMYLAIASYNPTITQEELKEITEYKNNIAQKLTQTQVVNLEQQAKEQSQK